jgi:hypothetical protein
MKDNDNKVRLTSFGEAQYPYLTSPDTAFNSDGIYQTKLKVNKNEAQEDIKIINDIISKEIAEEHKRKPGDTSLMKRAPLPYETDGEYIIFKFKTKFKPLLVDHNNQKIPEDKTVWGGSILRVKYKPNGYNVASTGVGCNLRLISCQITKLVEGSSMAKGFDVVPPLAEVI